MRCAVTVVERSYADRVPCRNKLPFFAVVYDERKFRIEHFKHFHGIFFIERKKYLAIAVAFKAVFAFELFFYLPIAVNLSVANDAVSVQSKRLHTVRGKPHNREPAKAHYSVFQFNYFHIVGASRVRLIQCLFYVLALYIPSRITHYRTHFLPLKNFFAVCLVCRFFPSFAFSAHTVIRLRFYVLTV